MNCDHIVEPPGCRTCSDEVAASTATFNYSCGVMAPVASGSPVEVSSSYDCGFSEKYPVMGPWHINTYQSLSLCQMSRSFLGSECEVDPYISCLHHDDWMGEYWVLRHRCPSYYQYKCIDSPSCATYQSTARSTVQLQISLKELSGYTCGPINHQRLPSTVCIGATAGKFYSTCQLYVDQCVESGDCAIIRDRAHSDALAFATQAQALGEVCKITHSDIFSGTGTCSSAIGVSKGSYVVTCTRTRIFAASTIVAKYGCCLTGTCIC